jgi:hypothetical protein
MYSFMHSLTSALDGGEWSASCPGHATPKERALSTHWIGGFDQTLKELEQADGHTFQMTNQPTQPNPTQTKELHGAESFWSILNAPSKNAFAASSFKVNKPTQCSQTPTFVDRIKISTLL